MIEISKIERSNRKTLSVSVSANGEVVVKAPLRLPEDEIYRFVNEKQNWIESKINKSKIITTQYNDVINYKKLLLFGKEYFGYYSQKVSKITICENKILIPSQMGLDKLHKKIMKWFKSIANQFLVSRVNEVSLLVDLSAKNIKCTGSRGRWGACTNKKEVFLNWRCVMLPPKLIDYVVVHELAHLIELNHSPKFWAVVAKFLPDYKIRKNELKSFSFVLKLF